jgi:hypothetical protein
LQPGAVDVEAGTESLTIEVPGGKVLHQVRQFGGRVGDGDILEVHDADAPAVPQIVGQVRIAVAQHRQRWRGP